MALFELSSDRITELQQTDFSALGVLERQHLQRLLRDHIEVIAPDTLVLCEEFSSWDRSDRRIDLFGVDRQARLVVVELKRTTDDIILDLQAIRYAAMVSQMTFEEAVETFRKYLQTREQNVDPRAVLLEFLGWADASEGRFGHDVRIVLAAADFSPEVTSTVLWLNDRDLDITCVRLRPYRLGEAILLDVQQIIPLPEAADYQIQIRQKQRETRAATEQSLDRTRYDVKMGDQVHVALSKRDTIFAAVAYLIGKGITPESIEQEVGRKMFQSADGVLEGTQFRADLARRRLNDPSFSRRYFSQDDQLFVVNGRTYAVTNQWSKNTLESVMTELTRAYSALDLTCRESNSQSAA